jgi:hypothetical protein
MRFFFVLAVSALMGATLLAANTRHGRDLLHPLYDLDLVDDINGFELYTPGRPAHPDRRHRWCRVERRTIDEHELDVAGKAAAAEAPPIPYAVKDMPHFTERRRPGSIFAANASTASATPRCGCGKLAI